MDLSLSAAIKHLAKIEDKMGVKLVNRTTRPVSFTQGGEIYLEYARCVNGHQSCPDSGGGLITKCIT
ncbi:LysR family transcriptional regulator [Billgrantia aerodenitrificans]|uniref:LysR family transcriptional regulator n=1 Tax=Billgrantia aerodenitrificans TaxID=2733483 RepID=UPI003BEF066C